MVFRINYKAKNNFVKNGIVAAFKAKNSYSLEELFHFVHTFYKENIGRKTCSCGKEMLHLRIYEELQALKFDGKIKKDKNIYETLPCSPRKSNLG
jgi:hypothetical protein